MQSLGDVVSLKRTGPSIDPGPPRLLAPIHFTDGRRRLSLFSPLFDLATRDPTALPRLQERSGLETRIRATSEWNVYCHEHPATTEEEHAQRKEAYKGLTETEREGLQKVAAQPSMQLVSPPF